MTLKKFLKSKIHGARVTGTNLNYEGSISLPPSLLKEADIKPYEFVMVVNKNNGIRFETYAIKGKEGKVELNGGTARLGHPGDELLIFSFVLSDKEVKPDIIVVDENNRIKQKK